MLRARSWPRPTGEFKTPEADSAVLALDQDADPGVRNGVPRLEVTDGVLELAPDMTTGGAGGDMVAAERNATVAPGHGTRQGRIAAQAPSGTDTRQTGEHRAALPA